MELGDVSKFLASEVSPGAGPHSELLSQLNKVDSDKSTIFESIISQEGGFPQSFFNRSDFRVDICGIIPTNTKEYLGGARLYDSHGQFYDEVGQCISGFSNQDISGRLPSELLEKIPTPVSVHNWIHPNHRGINSFFVAVNSQTSPVCRGTYVNRMGFIVCLQDSVGELIEQEVLCRDTYGRVYRDGRYGPHGTISMFDLIYQMVDPEMTLRYIWSGTSVSEIHTDDVAPEMFNPVRDNRQHMREELFRNLLRAYELSNRLGVTFGFHMNDQTSLDSKN